MLLCNCGCWCTFCVRPTIARQLPTTRTRSRRYADGHALLVDRPSMYVFNNHTSCQQTTSQPNTTHSQPRQTHSVIFAWTRLTQRAAQGMMKRTSHTMHVANVNDSALTANQDADWGCTHQGPIRVGCRNVGAAEPQRTNPDAPSPQRKCCGRCVRLLQARASSSTISCDLFARLQYAPLQPALEPQSSP